MPSPLSIIVLAIVCEFDFSSVQVKFIDFFISGLFDAWHSKLMFSLYLKFNAIIILIQISVPYHW